MADSAPHASHKPPPAAIIAVPFIVALALTLFAWPASRLEPRDVPVGVAGPAAATQQIEARLASQEGAFEVHRYADGAAAREAIEDRDVYGAFVAGPAGAEVLTASAGSPTIAQLLTEAAGEARVTDVVPAAKEDPRGSGLAASVLPMVLAGILVGLAAIFLAPTKMARIWMVIAGSVLAGLAAILIAQVWLDILEQNWLANWAVLSGMVLAIAAVVAGFEALLGTPGIGVGALLMVLIGNPFAGVSSAPEMLPQPVGLIGQLMPPGAGGNAVRSTAFFDGAAVTGYLVVLVAWVLVGLTALLVAVARERTVAIGGRRPVEVASR
jgi:hypothetical protein